MSDQKVFLKLMRGFRSHADEMGERADVAGDARRKVLLDRADLFYDIANAFLKVAKTKDSDV